ncbi:hypothetical protein TREMEDRAFT_32602 [Tremella mesenterica DSM 1558]|uniref:uncharacterized protein n=1 Tax=Tremella mesenterica (strain ATCC 24925 / CBS 8224 / DSM 1558 / NBRC 9311 / NRRL Y-6157 / RJB 2259-6 / UBC 559-6) TaxID=578456 RepID=UPI0003F49C2F|nr:uncharacterized protein TREMEDRAFT_32602 [Tremella mesenterica DSM 1558]EIW67838.1 hypothetical protein TREMEDRAFT_32602 [Tremella mesenterica DSM 1558]
MSPTGPGGHVDGDASSGFVTISNSWSSNRGFSSMGGTAAAPTRPLAWASIRHQVLEDEKVEAADKGGPIEGCSQAVLVTCLHLSHEMALREVGQYAWTTPMVKDPRGSMMRIMNGKSLAHSINKYTKQVENIAPQSGLNVRAAPDPSKTSIQQHLQKARLAAGPDSYVAVIYSGHGIQEPPTEAGELWCYDKSFEECVNGGGPSEYIPILLFDLLTWAGAASCYVWDCAHAGRFVRAALVEAEEIDSQLRAAALQNPTVAELHPAVYSKRQIHFAACGADQVIPRIPGLPDDLFTSCLTSPLRVAILYHNLRTFPLTTTRTQEDKKRVEKYSSKSPAYMAVLWENLTQEIKDRLWSELSAILHTIAWQALEGKEYQKLFALSGDIISNLACGFLVAQKVLGSYHVNPESIPSIPSTTSHALWTTWELIMDNLFEQLPMWFDESTDSSWVESISLVSFMQDQLDSILGSDQSAREDPDEHYPTLSRLPIICQAALTEQFRHRAATALDACLRGLDIKGLALAIQGGALDTAAQLLALDDPSISREMISIWASLVRQDSAVLSLAKEGLTANRLTSVPCVRFFLDNLDRHVNSFDNDSITTTIQTAAVLSTIANFVAGRKAPLFTERTLKMAGVMVGLDHHFDTLREQLIDLIDSRVVEVRACAVYGLSRFIDVTPVSDIRQMKGVLDVTKHLLRYPRTVGSPLVRKELVRLWHRVLRKGGRWTSILLLMYFVQLASESIPQKVTECQEIARDLSEQLDLKKEQHDLFFPINNIFKCLHVMLHDPNNQVSSMVATSFKIVSNELRSLVRESHWAKLYDAVFPAVRGENLWTENQIGVLKHLKERLMQVRDKPPMLIKSLEGSGKGEWNSDLFEKTKMSLHAYLATQIPRMVEEEDPVPVVRSSERTWILRHRVLEDSLVVAEQQVGLPWKWNMKEMSTPDPWSFIWYHSFNSTVLSCNESPIVMLWDWSTARKTGQVKLKSPAGSKITSARFVNELHEQMVVLAEMNTGDIHVLAGPSHEPSQMSTISSFLALDVPRTSQNFKLSGHRHLRTTWWRQSGKLAVAGASEVLNVWDCQGERCERSLRTNATVACKTLITEPVSGNILLGGFADGTVRLFDLRQQRKTPLLSYLGDTSEDKRVRSGKRIYKLGVKLGESKHITTAGENGMINIHDLRMLTSPTSSILAHADGMAWASYQAHSGLMSTISSLNPPSGSSNLHSHSHSHGEHSGRPRVNWGLYRSTLSNLSTVTEDVITFANQQSDVLAQNQVPYTVIHPLRPFLGIGYGRSCLLRGSGVGKGEDTDSGSYSFLKAQARFVAD